MRITRRDRDQEGFLAIEVAESRLLSTVEERELLRVLGECKRKLTEALDRARETQAVANEGCSALERGLATVSAGDGPAEARLGAIFQRYKECRTKLALANVRLVAHVAKGFRERGIAHADLLQEGFCGLLQAIDRFDVTRETKLATYATWWIRQAMQEAVASGAYPVRLSARHLRQLAQNQDELDRVEPRSADSELVSGETIHRIHAATRPTVSLDSTVDDSSFRMIQTMSDPEGDHTDQVDQDETIHALMRSLRPREQQVLSLRFGLGGNPGLSLSQVGQVLAVSKERVRQIQDRALEKLRAAAVEQRIGDLLDVLA